MQKLALNCKVIHQELAVLKKTSKTKLLTSVYEVQNFHPWKSFR